MSNYSEKMQQVENWREIHTVRRVVTLIGITALLLAALYFAQAAQVHCGAWNRDASCPPLTHCVLRAHVSDGGRCLPVLIPPGVWTFAGDVKGDL